MTAATPPRRNAAPARQRAIVRIIHLTAGLALGALVYAPWEYVEPIRVIWQVAIVPLVAFSGLFLWKQAALRRVVTRVIPSPVRPDRRRDRAASGRAGSKA